MPISRKKFKSRGFDSPLFFCIWTEGRNKAPQKGAKQ
nr:MAG TPA: hypothetical protein [Caudoviricetes sp.]